MQVVAKLNNLKIAPRKVRLVSNVISGMQVKDALIELSTQVKRSSEPMEKLLRSAIANAEHNFGLDPSNLYISSSIVGEGQRLKRWQPRAFGRANPIMRRLSKITLILEETVPGLNRKERKGSDGVPTSVAPMPVKIEEPGASRTLLEGEEVKEAKKGVIAKQEGKQGGPKGAKVVKRVYQRKSF